jgi:CHASE3 domain sensor protein
VKLSRFNHILLETLLLPVVALLCVSGVLVWQILRAERTVARMQIAGQNIANANLISALIMDQETGVRGYQNTADDSFLEPYTLAGAPLRGDLQA